MLYNNWYYKINNI